MKLAPIAIAVALLTGCAGNKESIGTGVGAVAGAVIGNKLGGKQGAVIGAIIGGAIGNRIGAHLDEEDRKKLAELEQKALATGTGGSFVTNKSKATVTVGVSQPTLEKPREYGMSPTVVPQPLVLIDPITIRAYVDTPVYNTTSEAGTPKLLIAQGVPIRISAKVDAANWVVVGNDSVGLGYVHKRYLEASVVSEAAPVAAAPEPAQPKTGAGAGAGAKPDPKKKPPPPATKVAAAKSAPGQKLSTMSKEEYEKEMDKLYAAYKPRATGGPAPQTGPAGQSGVRLAQISNECKVITRQVQAPAGGGESFTESVKYCNEPPKGWQTQTA